MVERCQAKWHNIKILGLFVPDFLYQELQTTLRPLGGQWKIGEAGLGQGEHRDDQVPVGEEPQGDDASHSGQIALNNDE